MKKDGEASLNYRLFNLISKSVSGDTYLNCHGVCSNEIHVSACHQECYNLVPRERVLDVLRAAAWLYQPSYAEMTYRNRRLEAYAAEELTQALPRQLPGEVTTQIASHNLSTYATGQLVAQYDERNWGSFPIRFSAKIWARYKLLGGGLRYVAALSNEPNHVREPDEWRLIFDPDESKFKEMYVGYDLLGVREIVFANEPALADGWEHVWWEAIHIPPGDETVLCLCDVSTIPVLSGEEKADMHSFSEAYIA